MTKSKWYIISIIVLFGILGICYWTAWREIDKQFPKPKGVFPYFYYTDIREEYSIPIGGNDKPVTISSHAWNLGEPIQMVWSVKENRFIIWPREKPIKIYQGK